MENQNGYTNRKIYLKLYNKLKYNINEKKVIYFMFIYSKPKVTLQFLLLNIFILVSIW